MGVNRAISGAGCVFLAVFAAVLPCRAQVITFDDLAVGTSVSTLAGVTFSSNTGLPLIVASGFSTTSGTQYLGVGDGGVQVFLPNDEIEMRFETPINNITVNFISTANPPVGAFHLRTVFGEQVSRATPDSVLLDQGEVYTVSFFYPEGFLSALLIGSDPGAIYSFNVDDIETSRVPEPGTLGLTVLALLLVFVGPASNHQITARRYTA